MTLQEILFKLQTFWADQGCVIQQPLDLPVGAATFHPATFLKALGPKPWNCAFVQPCRRPVDGRFGQNPNRTQMFFQFQVVLKPSPIDIQEKYLDSLRALGVDPLTNDIRFVEDNWESPSLGAWGLGWEVWQNGMEVSQFTYFQQAGGFPCAPVTGELTYGVERLAMHLQDKENIFDLIWHETKEGTITYGDVYLENEQQMTRYNFDYANIPLLKEMFETALKDCKTLLEALLPLAAYEQIITASHTFNLLDARHAFSVTERQHHMLCIREASHQIAKYIIEQSPEASHE